MPRQLSMIAGRRNSHEIYCTSRTMSNFAMTWWNNRGELERPIWHSRRSDLQISLAESIWLFTYHYTPPVCSLIHRRYWVAVSEGCAGAFGPMFALLEKGFLSRLYGADYSPSLEREVLHSQESSAEVQSAQPSYSASIPSFNPKSLTTNSGFGKNSRLERQVVRKRDGFSFPRSSHVCHNS